MIFWKSSKSKKWMRFDIFRRIINISRCSLIELDGCRISHLALKALLNAIFPPNPLPKQINRVSFPTGCFLEMFQCFGFAFEQIQIVSLNQLYPPFNLTSLFQIQFSRWNLTKIKSNIFHMLSCTFIFFQRLPWSDVLYANKKETKTRS